MIAPNRSALVNTEYIMKLEKKKLLLRNGRDIDISRDRIGTIHKLVTDSFVKRMG